MDPAASTEPAAQPAAPVAEPVAPVTPPAPPAEPAKPVDPAQPAPDPEDQEWDDAADELFPGISKPKKTEEKKADEPAKPAEELEKPAEDKKAEEAAKSDEDEKEAEPDTSAMDARIAARQSAKAVAEVKADVRKQMFGDVPSEMRDADGDPIRSPADVMRLVNPSTGESFTQEEAAAWFNAAQANFERSQQQLEQQINEIAEVNVDLKDQADIVNYRYGELLKAMPELRDRLWKQFQETLSKDEKSGIIKKAPVSLFEFYETALEPYAAYGRQADEQEANKAAEDARAAEAAKAAEEQKKVQTRQDRSDIYGGGQIDDKDPEAKEWAQAAETVFGPKK